MKSPRILLTALSALALSLTAIQAQASEIDDAIEQLGRAKHSEHPVEHLERAKHNLEDAPHHHHGDRAEALRHTVEAIEAARSGEHRRMEEQIDKALHDLR